MQGDISHWPVAIIWQLCGPQGKTCQKTNKQRKQWLRHNNLNIWVARINPSAWLYTAHTSSSSRLRFELELAFQNFRLNTGDPNA